MLPYAARLHLVQHEDYQLCWRRPWNAWTKGRPLYDPSEIRVPTMLILGEWDRETPLYMSQEVFSKMTSAPTKRLVVIAEGTHAIVLEKNRMELIRQIQGFLEE